MNLSRGIQNIRKGEQFQNAVKILKGFSFSCEIAKHRKSNTLEVKDLQMYLENNWDIRVPGFVSPATPAGG